MGEHVAPWSFSAAVLCSTLLVDQQHFSTPAPLVATGAGRPWVWNCAVSALLIVTCPMFMARTCQHVGLQPPQLFFLLDPSSLPCLGAGPLAMAQGIPGYGEQVCL